MNAVLPVPRQSVRLHIACQLSPDISVRGRAESVRYDVKEAQETGIMGAEGTYKLAHKGSAALRLQYFNTDGFNNRIYVYESDVLYGYSIPLFSGKGFRMYVNLNYHLTEKCSIWLRWAETVYTDRITIGSGLEQIKGRRRTELKLQARWLF